MAFRIALFRVYFFFKSLNACQQTQHFTGLGANDRGKFNALRRYVKLFILDISARG